VSLDVCFQSQIVRDLDRALAVVTERERARFVGQAEQVAAERVIMARAVAAVVRQQLVPVRIVRSRAQRSARAEATAGPWALCKSSAA
jgi:hypothetical protein